MLAAMELDHQRTCNAAPFGRLQTYTYACPRVGDATFASLFGQRFPGSNHWAFQVPNDAVPHLPFMAWGFRHPTGVALLGGKRQDGTPMPLRQTADRGDSVDLLRPRDGVLENWVTCHDLDEYLGHLSAIQQPQQQPAMATA